MDILVDRLEINSFFDLKKWKIDSTSYEGQNGTFDGGFE
jgi:hypothetical protein